MTYMLEEIRGAHKTYRDWRLHSSSSESMSDDEDSKPSAINHLDNNNNIDNNGNTQGINREDDEETEEL
jgi:hypothetical protein